MAIQEVSGYRLLEMVGEGPRATVYKVRDPKSRSVVALKLFHSPEIQPADLPRLQHPHVAATLDIGHANSQVYVVSEFLPGGTLKDHIRSMQSVGDLFPPDQILHYAGQIAEALLYAHDHGFSHGNLKPENVLFGADGTLKLTDFTSQKDAGQDLEAFGQLLYEMATGRPPLPGAALPPIDKFRKDLSSGFTRLVVRLVDSERADHPKELSSVVAELKALPPPQPATYLHNASATVARPADSGSAPPALAEGRLLAGRFRIVKFIDRGGMGDVYEAEDLELRERVALKTVRPEIAGVPQAMERFKREIQLARRVTHPNVCRIFDIFHDKTESGDITFLTMELLPGETLHHRLSRIGRMTTTEALPIIRQMAAGLGAAHNVGVIHRDFKSSNVMLIPLDADAQQFRAVVTDFGLARPAIAHQSLATLSNAGEALGTPAYMAPEQLENGPITPATDIYALGIVIYEAIAGTLPWDGDSGLAVALKRLQGPPPSPRVHVPELDEVWEAGILRCLERRQADRFSDVDSVLDALTGDKPAALPASSARLSTPEPVVQTKTHPRRFAFVTSVVLVVALLAVALAVRNSMVPSGFKSRRSVAVLGFKNLTGEADSAWLSTALSEMLTTELSAGEKLRTIPGETVARMSKELALPESNGFSPDTLARIRNYAGADVIVYGSYVVLNGDPAKVRMDLRVQDSVQGTLLADVSQEGFTADLLTLVSRSGEALREKLGIGKLEASELKAAQAALPATPAAARHYADGLEKLRVFDAAGARGALEKAIAEDGRHALARAGLATAWAMSGNPRNAREQSQIALELSAGLGREDRLVVEGRSREAAREWAKAVEVYRTLFGFFPDNVDYGVRLAEAQTASGNGKDALSTIASLRQFPPPDRDSPRIDMAEAHAAGALSDFKRQQSMAARAAGKAKERGATLLMAGAKLIEGSAFANLGEWSQARGALEEARKMYSAAGDHWDAVNASTNLGYVSMQSGDWDSAEDIYRESLTTYRQLGDRKGEAAALTWLGTLFRNRGNFSRARTNHEQALKIQGEIGDRLGEAVSRNNLANLLSLVGDSQAAREMYQTALPVFREVGDRNAVATVLSNLGDLVSDEGDLARARELYEESRATFQELGIKHSVAHELSRLGDLDVINGDMPSARKRHEEALMLRQQLGENGGIGESQLALAQISLHEGDAASAEVAAKAAAAAFATMGRPDDEASAQAVLARSLLALEKQTESAQSIQRAEELSRKSSDRGIRLSVSITGASIRASRGEAAKSLKDLEGIIREARSAKLLRLELEARLAVAEIEVATGRFPAGRQHLDALEMEASSRGYKYIAARAAAAKKKIPALTA
jgi:eukaryotic-like serine/threonine-protein kinase